MLAFTPVHKKTAPGQRWPADMLVNLPVQFISCGKEDSRLLPRITVAEEHVTANALPYQLRVTEYGTTFSDSTSADRAAAVCVLAGARPAAFLLTAKNKLGNKLFRGEPFSATFDFRSFSSHLLFGDPLGCIHHQVTNVITLPT